MSRLFRLRSAPHITVEVFQVTEEGRKHKEWWPTWAYTIYMGLGCRRKADLPYPPIGAWLIRDVACNESVLTDEQFKDKYEEAK